MDFIKWSVIYKRLDHLNSELRDVSPQRRIKNLMEISKLSETAADIAELMEEFNRYTQEDLDIKVDRDDEDEDLD